MDIRQHIRKDIRIGRCGWIGSSLLNIFFFLLCDGTAVSLPPTPLYIHFGFFLCGDSYPHYDTDMRRPYFSFLFCLLQKLCNLMFWICNLYKRIYEDLIYELQHFETLLFRS